MEVVCGINELVAGQQRWRRYCRATAGCVPAGGLRGNGWRVVSEMGGWAFASFGMTKVNGGRRGVWGGAMFGRKLERAVKRRRRLSVGGDSEEGHRREIGTQEDGKD